MQRLQEQLDLQWDYLEARDGRIRQVRQEIFDVFGEMALDKRESVAHTKQLLDEAAAQAQRQEAAAHRRDELTAELDKLKSSDETANLAGAKKLLVDLDRQIEELKLKRAATRQQVGELESVVGARESRISRQLEALPAQDADIAAKVTRLRSQLEQDTLELLATDQGQQLWRSVMDYLAQLDKIMQGPPIQIVSALEEAVEWLTAKGTFVESKNWGPLVVAIGHELEIVREALDAVKSIEH